MNNSKLVILRNNRNVDNLPIIDPNINLLILSFLFSIIDSHKSNIKSKEKLSKKIKSRYIFM